MALPISDRALGQMPGGAAAAARALCLSAQHVCRWADPESGVAVPAADVAVLAKRSPAFAAYLLGALSQDWARDPIVPPVPPSVRTLRLQERLGALAHAVVDAEADGKLTDGELEEIERRVGQMQVEMDAMRADIRRRLAGRGGDHV